MTKHLVRIKNDMHGYECDYVLPVEADSQQQALAIARNFDYYANITIVQSQETKMTEDEIDDLVRNELEALARNLADEAMLGNQESLKTLDSFLGTIEYYSTKAQYNAFEDSLPSELFSDHNMEIKDLEGGGTLILATPDSPLVSNLMLLGYKAYMGMAGLGFITIEELINYAAIGQNQKN